MAGRTWEVGDRVAINDHIGAPRHLGSIIDIRPNGRLAIRGDTVTGTVRHPDDARVIPAEDVPVDERHWLPQRVRDQLVRQEAAARLRALGAAWPGRVLTAMADEMAKDLDDLLEVDPRLTAAARALLSPAPALATTP